MKLTLRTILETRQEMSKKRSKVADKSRTRVQNINYDDSDDGDDDDEEDCDGSDNYEDEYDEYLA